MQAASTEAPSGEDGDLDRIWTLPNVISISRIVLLGVFCLLLFAWDERIAATVELMVVGVTDFLDGYLARRFHQVSNLGKVLDPVADRVVLVTGVISIAVYGAVPGWLAGIVLGREVMVSVAVTVGALRPAIVALKVSVPE